MPDSVFNHFVQSNFDDATQKQIAKLRSDVQSGKPDSSAETLNVKAMTTAVNNRLQSLGISTKPTDADGKAQLGTVTKFIQDGLFDQQHQLGRKMTPEEVEKFVDQQFLKNYQFHNTYMGIAGGSQAKPYLSMKVDDLPDSALTSIKQAFASRGNSNPSNDQILRAFWNKRMTGQQMASNP